jgi:hypothetical protein
MMSPPRSVILRENSHYFCTSFRGGGQGDIDKDWIRQGAGPDSNNFRSFNLTADGIVILFDPYHVGFYAWGIREVKIPYYALSSILDWTGPVMSAVCGGFKPSI